MKRRRKNFSYKSVFIFVFVVVLAAAIISASPSGALFVKKEGVGVTTIPYKNVCVDSDVSNINNEHFAGKTFIKQLIKGEVYTIRVEYDVCRGANRLQEYFCYDNRIYSDIVTCDQGCENGACIPCLNCPEITTTCTDSDGGKVFYISGEVTVEAKTYNDVCDGTLLREYYCLNGQAAWEWRQCPKDCMYGACLSG